MESAEDAFPTHWGKNQVRLHDEGVKFFKFLKSAVGPVGGLSMEERRKRFSTLIAEHVTQPEYNGNVEDKRIPSPEVKEGLLVRVYTPAVLPRDPVIMLYFHGGGHLYGHIDDNNHLLKTLSSMCECIIVDVDYRLCPENKFPAGMRDCVTATEWAIQNKSNLGGSTNSPVGVAGDSAGGQCALYVSHNLKGLHFQIAVYPNTDFTCNLPSMSEFNDGPITTKSGCISGVDMILDEDERRDDPEWSMLYQTDFSNIPPTLILLAEIDAMRDDGREYAKKLIDAAVPVDVLEIKGASHMFFTWPDHFKESTKEAYTKIKNFVNWIESRKR